MAYLFREKNGPGAYDRMVGVQEELARDGLGPFGYCKGHCGLCVPGTEVLKRTDDGTSLNI
jgi:hypothetical protein